MAKKQKNNSEVQEQPIQIIATEIRLRSTENLLFRSFKIMKGEELIISDKAFDELLDQIPNLKIMLEKGVVEIVK